MTPGTIAPEPSFWLREVRLVSVTLKLGASLVLSTFGIEMGVCGEVGAGASNEAEDGASSGMGASVLNDIGTATAGVNVGVAFTAAATTGSAWGNEEINALPGDA